MFSGRHALYIGMDTVLLEVMSNKPDLPGLLKRLMGGIDMTFFKYGIFTDPYYSTLSKKK